jgi:hypothetical protein
MSCSLLDVGCVVSDIAASAGNSVFDKFERWVATGAATAIRVAVTGWISVPSPDISSASSGVAYLTAYTRPIVYVIFVLALIVQAGQLAWTQRGEDLRELLRGIGMYVLVAGAGAGTFELLTIAGDGYSNWILTESTTSVCQQVTGAAEVTTACASGSLSDRIVGLLGVATATPGTANAAVALPIAGALGALLFGLVMISGILQVILIYARAIILILMLGLLPVAAAAAMTRRGRQLLDRYLTWIIAWVLYKPTAATIYAAGFWMLSNGGVMSFVGGLGALILATFSLFALMRLINPMVASVGGGGGSGAADGLAAGAAAATGAMQLAGGLSGSSSGGGGGEGGGGSMPVNDATFGSRPSGSRSAGGGSAAGAGAKSGAGAAGGGATGAAAGGAGAGAAASGGAAAAAGPVGAVVAAVPAAAAVATAPIRGAHAVAEEATGSGGER